MWPRRPTTMPAAARRTESSPQEDHMAWTKPRVTEVSLALEINSYACADVG